MKRILALALALASSASMADDWTGQDKMQHMAGSALIAASVTAITRDEVAGFQAALAVGIAKEMLDSRRAGHTASVKDLAADVIGAYIGSKVAGVALIPQRGGFTLTLHRRF